MFETLGLRVHNYVLSTLCIEFYLYNTVFITNNNENQCVGVSRA